MTDLNTLSIVSRPLALKEQFVLQQSEPKEGGLHIASFHTFAFANNGALQQMAAQQDVIIVEAPSEKLPFGSSLDLRDPRRSESVRNNTTPSIRKLMQLENRVPVICVVANENQERLAAEIWGRFPVTYVTGTYDLTTHTAVANVMRASHFKYQKSDADVFPFFRIRENEESGAIEILSEKPVRLTRAEARLMFILSGGEFCGNTYLYKQYAIDNPAIGAKIIAVQSNNINKKLSDAGLPLIESIANVGRQWPAQLARLALA
ncbi:MAG: hypothetical protein WAO98_01770 [Alphaproteobacteria bacterium]